MMTDRIKSISALLIACVLITAFSVAAFGAEEYGVTQGLGIQLRKEPVNGEIISRLNSGVKVKILEESGERDGADWYRVSVNAVSANGYIRSDFVRKGLKGAEEIIEGSTYKTVVDGAKIKAEPGNDKETLCTLNNGAVCTVISSVFDIKSGYYWFLVTFEAVDNVTKGYIRYDCLNINDYSSELNDEGFPESYLGYLSSIHDLFPNFEFKAYYPASDMTFNECVDVETGISVVESTGFINAASLKKNRRSRADSEVESSVNSSLNGLYSVVTQGRNEMHLFWTTAGRSEVAYYMDPRNFMLTSSGDINPSFFMFLSGTDTSGTDEDGVKEIFSTTSMTGTIPGENMTYSELVYDYSVSKGVNPYLVAARMRQEHGNKNGDDLINGNYSGYEGYYNYFNIGANGDVPVVNGLKRAKEEGWNSRVRSIKGGIDYLSEEYFLSSLHKQDTLYKQRFFFKNKTYYHQYMTGLYAPHKEAEKVYKGYGEKKSSDAAGVFLIPVFKDMPEEPASRN